MVNERRVEDIIEFLSHRSRELTDVWRN